MFERYTARARRCVVLAQEACREMKRGVIDQQMVLLGVVWEGEGVGPRALALLGVTRDAVKNKIPEGDQSPQGHIPFSPEAKRVLELALREALQLGHNYIGTEHIVLALVRDDAIVAFLSEGFGVTAADVRKTVVDELGPPQPTRDTSTDYQEVATRAAAGLVRFCPGCGSGTSLEFDPEAFDNSERPYNPVFDVCCTRCSWSGDISPDIALGKRRAS